MITGGADWTGKGYENHPVTGVALRGLKIPYFQEAKEFVLKMIDDLHIEGVIGWDIAIGEDGPLLIEPNGNPDPALLNLPFIPDHKGIKARLDKYL